MDTRACLPLKVSCPCWRVQVPSRKQWLQLPSEDDASFDCFEHESIAPSEGKAKLFGREARCLNPGRSPFEQEAQPLGKTSRQFLRDNDNVDVTPQVEVSSCNRSCHYRGQEIDAFGEILNVAFRRPDQFQLISLRRAARISFIGVRPRPHRRFG